MKYLNNLLTSAAMATTLYGCSDNNDVAKLSGDNPKTPVVEYATTNPSELEGKLTTILRNTKERFQISEMKSKSNIEFYCNQMRQQELINPNSTCDYEMPRDERDYVINVMVKVRHKLGIHEVSGLEQDYFAMETTPLSEEAKKDIKAYDEFQTALKNHFHNTYKEGQTIMKDDFFKTAYDFAATNLNLDEGRERDLAIYGAVTNIRDFNVVTEQELKDSEFDVLGDIIDGIELE